MNILMIGPFPPVLNGVTVSNNFLYQWLTSKGKNVSKINTETGLIASRQGDQVSILKILRFLSIYFHVFKVVGKSAVYMTIGQTFWGLVKYSPFILFSKMLGVPYVLHIHGGYVCKAYASMSPFKQRIFRYLFEGSRSVIALSASLAEEIEKTFPDSAVEVVENFYDPRLIENPVERTAHEIPRILFLSNLMLGKGIVEFLDALLLLKENKQLDFEVAIAGRVEKEIEDTIHQKIKRLGKTVYFFGSADFEKKKELLYWSDMFVLPTWYMMEGQPISIIEAYVTGNIVLATFQGGIKDIAGYESFVYVPAQNAEALAEIIHATGKNFGSFKDAVQATVVHAQKRFEAGFFGENVMKVLVRVKA